MATISIKHLTFFLTFNILTTPICAWHKHVKNRASKVPSASYIKPWRGSFIQRSITCPMWNTPVWSLYRNALNILVQHVSSLPLPTLTIVSRGEWLWSPSNFSEDLSKMAQSFVLGSSTGHELHNRHISIGAQTDVNA